MDQHRINALLNLLSCFDRTEMSLSKGRRTRARVRERISASPIVLSALLPSTQSGPKLAVSEHELRVPLYGIFT